MNPAPTPFYNCCALCSATSCHCGPSEQCKTSTPTPAGRDYREKIIAFVKAAINLSNALISVDTIHDQSMSSAKVRQQHRKDVLREFHKANGEMGEIAFALKAVAEEEARDFNLIVVKFGEKIAELSKGLDDERERSARLIAVAQKLKEQFEAIKTEQHSLLVEGQDLKTASENWDIASDFSMDFQPLFDALAAYQQTPTDTDLSTQGREGEK